MRIEQRFFTLSVAQHLGNVEIGDGEAVADDPLPAGKLAFEHGKRPAQGMTGGGDRLLAECGSTCEAAQTVHIVSNPSSSTVCPASGPPCLRAR
ncbi:hypothetical protein AOG23_02200 [Rhizobium acidisoli]|nr:hypothetical protein AOG23_02200 [Rhizobium acidisoli]